MANKVTLPQLTSECMGTMFGGVINIANILPYGTFCVCEDEALQEELYEELKSIWGNANDAIPSYGRLIDLPLLVRELVQYHLYLIFYLHDITTLAALANLKIERCRQREFASYARYYCWTSPRRASVGCTN
jgi:hypothetical protein